MFGSSEVRPSIRCTSTPSAAKIEAYSTPMMPGADDGHALRNAVDAEDGISIADDVAF